jgi:hypothetical protein
MIARWLDTEALSALLIGVLCQVSVILIVGAAIHWFSNISEVPVGTDFLERGNSSNNFGLSPRPIDSDV